MSTEARTHLLTAEEFYQLPDPIEGGKMELVRGEVVTYMPVGGQHAEIALTIGQALRTFAKEHQLGSAGVEPGFILRRNPDVVRAPDAAFITKEQLPGGRMPKGFIQGRPALAVEVISPKELDAEVADKIADYLAAGTERIWIVRPQQKTVTVIHPDRSSQTLEPGQSLTSDDAGFSVEGFSLPLDELFAE